jgi:hypothetical protein
MSGKCSTAKKKKRKKKENIYSKMAMQSCGEKESAGCVMAMR